VSEKQLRAWGLFRKGEEEAKSKSKSNERRKLQEEARYGERENKQQEQETTVWLVCSFACAHQSCRLLP
jgi:hypothetical protein